MASIHNVYTLHSSTTLVFQKHIEITNASWINSFIHYIQLFYLQNNYVNKNDAVVSALTTTYIEYMWCTEKIILILIKNSLGTINIKIRYRYNWYFTQRINKKFASIN